MTLEANPSSVEAERFRGYRAAGVNRVSLGVQALNDADLEFLGRLHNVAEARAAIEIARTTFPRLSFDLIYARPGPDARGAGRRSWRRRSTSPPTTSRSTSSPSSPARRSPRSIAAGKLKVPDEDAAADLYARHAGGLRRGRPAGLRDLQPRRARAPSAGTTSSTGATANMPASGPAPTAGCSLPDGRHATAAERMPESLAREGRSRGATGSIVDDVLTREEEGDEMLLMGLRLAEGIDVGRYRSISGRALDPARLTDLVAHGMVEPIRGGRVRATRAGFFVLDAVVADLAA